MQHLVKNCQLPRCGEVGMLSSRTVNTIICQVAAPRTCTRLLVKSLAAGSTTVKLPLSHLH